MAVSVLDYSFQHYVRLFLVEALWIWWKLVLSRSIICFDLLVCLLSIHDLDVVLIIGRVLVQLVIKVKILALMETSWIKKVIWRNVDIYFRGFPLVICRIVVVKFPSVEWFYRGSLLKLNLSILNRIVMRALHEHLIVTQWINLNLGKGRCHSFISLSILPLMFQLGLFINNFI